VPCSFAAAGQRLWNSLPTYLRQPDLSKPWSISTSTQDAFVSGCMTAALSDYLFFSAVYKYPYLLTYNTFSEEVTPDQV